MNATRGDAACSSPALRATDVPSCAALTSRTRPASISMMLLSSACEELSTTTISWSAGSMS
jgi:hypothetical protein